jgi:hypothetical protein
VIRVHEFLENK